MAVLAPFRALRPVPSVAARVAAPPYDVVSPDEARALAAAEPLSFIRVSRAEADLPPGTPPYSDEVYARAVTNMAALTRDAPLMVEPEPSLYVYRLTMGAHAQTGIAGCFSLDEYDRNLIKKHERTRRDKEDDRTRHILEVRAQTGPVFLTFRDVPAISALSAAAADTPPLIDFTAADGIRHTLWRAASDIEGRLVTAFAAVPALYIADGHHRAASAARVRARLRERHGAGDWDLFLAVAFSDREVQVLPYHRVVRDLGAHTPASLRDALRRQLTLRDDAAAVPRRRGEVAMLLDGRWQTLVLGDPPADASPDRRLDVSLLQENVLSPLLGIDDVTTDRRIDFVGGIRGTAALESAVREGQAAVAFSMFPVSVDDVMRISDADGIMPPKSTWFEPKLRDGLLVHTLDGPPRPPAT